MYYVGRVSLLLVCLDEEQMKVCGAEMDFPDVRVSLEAVGVGSGLKLGLDIPALDHVSPLIRLCYFWFCRQITGLIGSYYMGLAGASDGETKQFHIGFYYFLQTD